MKIVILAVVVAVAVGGLLLISSVPSQDAVAGYNQKIHFVKTLESAPSPGLGHESHQLVFILPMSEGVMYEGIMSYTSNVPVQIAIFHEIDGDGAGQPTWTQRYAHVRMGSHQPRCQGRHARICRFCSRLPYRRR